MKLIKKMMLIFLITTIIFITSGCWNYREVDDISIVVGTAIDKDKTNNKYIVTVEVIKPAASEQEPIGSEIISIEGDSVFDAVRNLILRSGKKLYWAHSKLIIVSQDIAKKSIIDITDWIDRDANTRSDMWMLVSKEKTAREILEGKTKLEEIVSFYLDDMFKNEISLSKYHAVPLWEFINNLSADGIAPILPTTNTILYKGKKIPQIYGTAVFKKEKMVGWLNGIETRSLLFIIDKLKGGLLTIDENVDNQHTKITLEIFNNKTSVKPIYTDGELIMKIDVKPTVGIAEISSTVNFIDEKGREKLKKDAEKLIARQIEEVITKVQDDYQSDIFGFGNIIQIEMPELWKQIKPDWDEIFSTLEIQVNVELDITGSALTSKPIKVGK